MVLAPMRRGLSTSLWEVRMSGSALKPLIDAAQAYESLFVPALFQEWAPLVRAAARVAPGARVLDVACGTGVLAREVARVVRPAGRVVGLDSNAGMLAVAAGLVPDIEWREGYAEALPFEDATFDAVVSQFGLMFFADRGRALREMLRVLVPDGGLAVAVWDTLESTPAYAAEVALIERLAGSRAADALRAPFVLGDSRRLPELFRGAGAAEVEVVTHHATARFPSVRTMVEADLRGWLPVMGVVLDETLIATILAEAEDVCRPFVTPAGRVEFDSPGHIVTGLRRGR